MLTWIWVAVAVIAVIILIVAVSLLLSRLSGLRRAGERLRLRQTEALRLQESVAALNPSLQSLRESAEEAQRRIAVIKSASGRD